MQIVPYRCRCRANSNLSNRFTGGLDVQYNFPANLGINEAAMICSTARPLLVDRSAATVDHELDEIRIPSERSLILPCKFLLDSIERDLVIFASLSSSLSG
ncbi:hypothetical protein O9992_00255 [Vibrio lentus]|nr:hypothetical protein [Vibrio lentus]